MVKKNKKKYSQFKESFFKRRIYLDYAATTPVDSRVLKAMLPYFQEKFGNTGSIHSFGQEAKKVLEESRKIIADAIKAQPKEIIFTSSATESNNLALKGVLMANKNKGRHIVVSQIEHSCILETVKWLEKQGNKVSYLSVDKWGLINFPQLKKLITKETILISVIHANNEIGVIQDIEKIGRLCREKGVYFHTDAVQSFGKIPINVNKMKIDLLTASSHKICGPKGAACLFIREGIKIEPLLHGGSQEFGLRSSTINLPAIVGFAKACQIYQKEREKENQRLIKLKDKLIKGILEKIPNVRLNGHPLKRLPNNANFSFAGIEGESIVVHLDLLGISASTGSACSSEKLEPSHVLLALNLTPEEAHGSLRLTLGRWTKESDIDYLLKVLPEVIKKLRKISPFKI